MKDYMTKKEAGYRIIMGMRAVGNQCKDCIYADELDRSEKHLRCGKLRALVLPTGTCGWQHGEES